MVPTMVALLLSTSESNKGFDVLAVYFTSVLVAMCIVKFTLSHNRGILMQKKLLS